MKHLTLIIHTSVQQQLTDQLRNLDLISGFTFSQVEGHGLEIENDAFLSARNRVVGYTPRLRVDILLEEKNVNTVLDSLRNATQDIVEHGIYWVTAVEQSGRL